MRELDTPPAAVRAADSGADAATAGSARRPAAGVPSPCVNVCRMNAVTGLCDGCARSLDEIAGWSALDDDARRAVWRRIDARRAAGAAATLPR
jgi:predicted Fe-S protein YdhL (DUF1289 family)